MGVDRDKAINGRDELRQKLVIGCRLVGMIVFCLWVSGAWAQDAQKETDSEKKQAESSDKHFQKAADLASSGKFEQAIPLFKKAIRMAPQSHPSAYYNLGEIYRGTQRCGEAVLYYTGYLGLEGPDSSTRDKLDKCLQKTEHGKIDVSVSPETEAHILVGSGYLGPASKAPFVLPAGQHEITVKAPEYREATKQVTVQKHKTAKLEFELDPEVHYGNLELSIDEEGATVKLEPRELEVAGAVSEPVKKTSPVDEPIKLPTGKYFLQVTKSNYDKWIRNIEISRDQTQKIRIKLSRSIPGLD